jgi:endoglucanase
LALSLFGCDDGGKTCAKNETPVGDQCVKTYGTFAVRVNSVGYLPNREKRATYAGASAAFSVVSEDGSVAYEGTASEPFDNEETGETGLRVADFGALRQTGEFHLEVEGVGRSPSFRIADDVYADVIRSLMNGLYGQRCGEKVAIDFDGSQYRHGACHMDDAWLDFFDKPSEKQPTLYGWHDAGDYGKYSTNGAFSVAMMLLAWQQFEPALARLELDIPEHGGALPDFLAECDFQLRWLLSMQLEDGSVSDRVTTASFDGEVAPEGSTSRRRLAPPTFGATAYVVATLARAARVLAAYDADLAARYGDAALRGFQFLMDNPTFASPEASVQAQFTGGYWNASRGGLFWAASEVWELTGDEAALEQVESLGKSVSVSPFWDWADVTNLGTFTYLLSERAGRDESVVQALTASLEKTVDLIQGNAETHAYGRSLGTQYWWGANGTVARTAMNVAVYDQLVPEAAHFDTIAFSLDNLLGRNFYGRSFVTRLGQHPPQHPHHRPSQADGNPEPWPGLLVGGPWSNSGGDLPATAWRDDGKDYQTNEIAINWNAAMIYAAASLLPRD